MMFGIIMFISSLFIFIRSLEIKTEKFSYIPSFIDYGNDIYGSVARLQIVNSYGLFRRMTGVDGRPEVIIFGSNDNIEWKEYEFYHKPGNVQLAPTFVMPHQPRLDWQLWFSALGSADREPYLWVLLHRIF